MVDKKQIIRTVLKLHHDAKSSHVGSSLSCIDILYDIYSCRYRPGDTVILSKAHASVALYATLQAFGHMPLETMITYGDEDGLQDHCHRDESIGIHYTGGSLGNGLGYGIGVAIERQEHMVHVILGDGELDEGSVYEALQLLKSRELANVAIYIDSNEAQGLRPAFNRGKQHIMRILSYITNVKIYRTRKDIYTACGCFRTPFHSHYDILTDAKYMACLEALNETP
jgi:transketolase N-terminal domain/subunit